MHKILVTGGGGYIGSHTVYKLLEKGYEVVIIDSFVNSNPKVIDKLKILCNKNNVKIKNKLDIFQGDLRDIGFINKIFNDYHCSGTPIVGVMHFAGLKSVNDSIKKPLKYWDYNFNSSLNLIKVMNLFSCNCMVFSSSATVYKSKINKKIREDSEIKPINAYGNTKFAIESFLNDIFHSSEDNWKIANLRYFNPIGAHESGLIGEDPNGIPNNIFPLMLKVASRKIKKLKIFGGDWPTPDGSGIRDYIHVLDLADGHINALDYLLNNSPQIINLNLGTGIGTSVFELIKIFEEVNQMKIPFEVVSRRKGDLANVVADNLRALEILNWKPKRNVHDMCKDGWQWQILNPNGY